MRRSLPDDFVPRAVCERCRRPERVCFCAHLPSLETKTRIILLQHPRERDMAIGTARMASLCLPSSELHIGVHFRGSSAIARALSDPERPAALLYPGEGAVDVLAKPPEGPITLVVVDGTWWQAKKLVRVNPELALLPRYAFTPPNPSEYRIRKEPHEAYVSTIEALVHVLGALEGDPVRFRALLTPFRAMIDRQVEYATNVRGYRDRHLRHKKSGDARGERVPAAFVSDRERVVCVSAETNAWPYRDRELRTEHREELVHWVAHRLGTGETLDVIVAPRAPIAPTTTAHVGLDEGALRAGVTPEELFARWRAFTRPGDVVCTWGSYASGVFSRAGGALVPEGGAEVDVRAVARAATRGRVGSMATFLEEHDPTGEPRPLARGRAGHRGAQLARVVTVLGERARSAISEPRSTTNEAR